MSTTIEPDLKSLTSKNGKTSIKSLNRMSDQATRANFWREDALPKIVDGNDWDVWSSHLAKRKSARSVDQLCQVKGTSLAWGVSFIELPTHSIELLQLAAQFNGKKPPKPLNVVTDLSHWLSGGGSEPQSVEFALECLAVANMLPRAASIVDGELWWAMIDALAEIVEQTIDYHIDAEANAEQALAHQLLAGELPLTLSCLFPEMRPLFKLRTRAQDMLTEGLMEFLNGAGLPRASFLSVFRGLVACWTRVRIMSAESNKSLWSSKAEQQFRWAITKAICLSSSSGAALLGGDEVPIWSADFLASTLQIGGNPTDRTAAIDLFDKRMTKTITHKSGKRLPETSESCEWSGLAVLRTEMQRKKAVVAVDFSTPDMKLDVWSGPQRLLFGSWTGETIVSGQKLQPVGNWEETCWFSDPDVDYIELSIDLEQGARWERQIVLARKDKFLLLVDNVMNVPGNSISHRLSLPLGAGVGFVPEAETREGSLVASKSLARVFPLGLPEWRTDPRIGELTSVGDQLQLVHERPGKNLSCPLFVDLDPKRLSKDCTWRQLTVAQALEIQPHDVAVGYRIQCGKAQWLIYRSLTAPANRTVLGYNLSNEGLVGRFLSPSGTVEELLQIEG